MRKPRRTLRDRYLPVLMTAIMLLVGLALKAQTYQVSPNRMHFKSVLVEENFGPPKDTFAVLPAYRDRAHIAFIGDVMYIWSPSLQRWTVSAGGSASNDYAAGWGLSKTDTTFSVDSNQVATLWKLFDALNNYVNLNDTLWDNTYQRALNAEAMGSGTNLTFQNGLYRVGNTVNSNYGTPMWNANMIQSRYITAAQPMNGQTLMFDSTQNLYVWGFPDSVKLTNYYTKGDADGLFYPLSANPAGYLTEETDATALAALIDSAAAIRSDMGSGSGGAVSSVFGRTGAVTALEVDYSAFYPLLSGSYNDPVWINQLAWSKITGTPTTLSGYGITDAFDGDYNSLTNKPTLFNGVYSSLTGIPSTFAPSAHYHDAADVSSGTFGASRFAGTQTDGFVLTLASGVPTWQASTGGGSSSGWGLTGNAGTSSATNFIGTTDAQSVVFKANNDVYMTLNYSNNRIDYNKDVIVGGGSGFLLSGGGGSPYIRALGSPGLTLQASASYGIISGSPGATGLIVGGSGYTQVNFLGTATRLKSTSGLVSWEFQNLVNHLDHVVDINPRHTQYLKKAQTRIYSTAMSNGYSNVILQHNGTTTTGNIGIGTATPDTTVLVEISSTTQFVLPVRMTETQRNTAASKVYAGTITNSGGGYTTSVGAPVTLTGGSGTGATGSAVISGGIVTALTITNRGTGYQVGDVLTIVGTASTATYTVTHTAPVGATVFCTDCMATDGSTGVEQSYTNGTWKNKW